MQLLCQKSSSSSLFFPISTRCTPLKAACKMAPPRLLLSLYTRDTLAVWHAVNLCCHFYTLRHVTVLLTVSKDAWKTLQHQKPSGNLKINLLLSLTAERKDENSSMQLVTKGVVSHPAQVSQRMLQSLLQISFFIWTISNYFKKIIYNIISPIFSC